MARSAVLDFPLAWRTGRALVSACLALSISVPLHAQAYPARSVHLVTAAPAGSASDFVARLLAPQFSASLKAPFIVENRPDAGGTNVLRSAVADGHTLQLASLGSLVIAPAIASAPYDPLEFLAPVAQVASMPNVLTVHPDAGATTLDDLIALAKKEPGRIRYATAGNGMPGIYAGELFKSVAKVDLAFVQPRNGIAALDDLAQGRVNFLIAATPTAVPHVKTGKIRALAVTANRRLQALPDVPTAIENGLAGYEATTWYGIVVPAGTPQRIIDRLHKETANILSSPETAQTLEARGIEVTPSLPEQFSAYIKRETLKWKKVIGAAADNQDVVQAFRKR